MQNDFENRDLWIVRDRCDNKKYYIRMYGKWIEVPRDVYLIYDNSYHKMYRTWNNEKDRVKYYEDIDIITETCVHRNPIDEIMLKDRKCAVNKVIASLSEEEQFIIIKLFYEDYTERQLAKVLNISNTTLHYRKIKILKKMKEIFEQNQT